MEEEEPQKVECTGVRSTALPLVLPRGDLDSVGGGDRFWRIRVRVVIHVFDQNSMWASSFA
jgi:hypothetical protein